MADRFGQVSVGSRTLYVAGRGNPIQPVGGLYRFERADRRWSGERLAAVRELSSLARHPWLPVVYGTAGTGNDGRLHAWRVDDGRATTMADIGTSGGEPCFVSVHPAGRLLIVTNYVTGTLASWRLDDDGGPIGSAELTVLTGAGSGAEPDRQDWPHPHQAVVSGDEMLVPDLGADLVRRFEIDEQRIGRQTGCYRVPPGTGPRHLAVGVDGTIAVSGELAQTISLISGSLLATIPSTGKVGAARSRPPRNYPGDLQIGADNSIGYLANRGHDTISVVRLGARSRLIAEVDSGVRWPQHLLVTDHRLYVAGWDSSEVVALPLDVRGMPGEPEKCFGCPGAAWLLPAS